MYAQSQNNHWHFMVNVSGFHCCIETKQPSVLDCRNPNLAKCGGEAQHLKRVGIWSPLGLPNV
jgi:hypothetical protein